MNALTTLLCLYVAIQSPATPAADIEGCKDMKLFKRISGCVIVACSSKQRDTLSVQVDANDTRSLDASIDSITYSCPASVNPRQIDRDLGAMLRLAAYQIVFDDTRDLTNVGLTARKGTQWIQLNSESVDDATTYSLDVAETGVKKVPNAETCMVPHAPSLEKRCVVVECNYGASDTVQMRTSPQGGTALKGSLLASTLVCAESTPSQVFDSAEKELRDSSFEIVFDDRTHADDSWLTGRLGKRWVELSNLQDSESMLYLLTVIPSAETVTESRPRSRDTERVSTTLAPSVEAVKRDVSAKREESAKAVPPSPQIASIEPLAPHAAAPIPPGPAPPHADPPETTVAVATLLPPKAPAPNIPPSRSAPKLATAPFGPVTPPKLLVEVPMDVPSNLKRGIVGEVVITVSLVVDNEGKVAEAALAGKITKNVQKLEKAALDAVRRWKFEPARQGGQNVPGETTVKLHFEGEVIRIPSIH